MSNALSEMDRELLGEVSYNNGGEAPIAKANGGPGNGAFEGYHGAEFTPLNATAGTLIKVSNNSDTLEPGPVSISAVAHLTNPPPAIFCFLRPHPVSKHPHFIPHMSSLSLIPVNPSHHSCLRQTSLHLKLGTPHAVKGISTFPI